MSYEWRVDLTAGAKTLVQGNRIVGHVRADGNAKWWGLVEGINSIGPHDTQEEAEVALQSYDSSVNYPPPPVLPAPVSSFEIPEPNAPAEVIENPTTVNVGEPIKGTNVKIRKKTK